MNLSDFHYNYPEELVAQHPLPRRDDSRMMVLHRAEGGCEDRRIADFPEFLKPDDLVVFNDTRVFAARLFGKTAKRPVEILLLEKVDNQEWNCLGRGLKKIPAGEPIRFGPSLTGHFTGHNGDRSRLRLEGENITAAVEAVGLPPLPPYIVRRSADAYSAEDRERYQSLFAKRSGSSAAPTASLHFSETLLGRIPNKTFVTLHVSTDTFQPIRCGTLAEHKMHGEFFDVPEMTQEKIAMAKAAGGRIFAVGTTTVRALESRWSENRTELFITPGFKFKIVDALLTNFHQPDSTLICLASAFAGRKQLLHAYKTAVTQQYRLFSFGDAMLILQE